MGGEGAWPLRRRGPLSCLLVDAGVPGSQRDDQRRRGDARAPPSRSHELLTITWCSVRRPHDGRLRIITLPLLHFANAGHRVVLRKVGIFEKRARVARVGRDINTGNEIQIPARDTVVFVAAPAFKHAVREGNMEAFSSSHEELSPAARRKAEMDAQKATHPPPPPSA